MSQCSMATFVAVFLVSVIITSCSAKIEDLPAYQAACEGPPLRTIERRNTAMEDGYNINRQYDCIDKASFAAIAREKAEWQAANTPDAIAKRQADFAALRAQDEEARARRVASEAMPTEALPNIVLRNVDVNSATEAEIANVVSVSPELAAQIINERNKRPFADWADMVNRVIGFRSAQAAFYASVCGLNVNGNSLDGAPPNATMAAMIYKKYQPSQKHG